MRSTGIALLACAGIALFVPDAHAQQTTNGLAAPQPGKGRLAVREKLTFTRYNDDPSGRDVHQTDWTSEFTLGVSGDLAISATLPLAFRSVDGDDDRGVLDFPVLARYRIVQEDTSPTDTARLVVIAGAEIPSGEDEFSSKSIDPIIGFAYTRIIDRHGFNLGATWKFTTNEIERPIAPGDSEDDLLRFDAAYLYRLSPEAYTIDTRASTYFQLELNTFYETNSDHEVFIAPGFLYEGRTWAAEISVQFPVARDLEHRPERDIALVVGIRFLF